MKCADVVLDARELAATPRDARDGGMKANRWFNCACARRRETTRAMERDEAARDGGTRAVKELEGDSVDAFVEGAVTVDVYFERGGDASTSGERALVERWAFHAGADGERVGGNNHFNKDLDTAVVYKRAVIMVRTVVAMLRTLPAHGARLRAMRRRGARDGGGGGGFSFEIKNVDRGGTIASAHPGKAEGYRTYAFTDVPTSIVKLSACVYFLDQVAMSALEEMVEVMSKLEVDQEKLRAAPAAMAGRWDSLFDDPDAARAAVENKFADLGARVEARCREMAAYLPYGSRAEAERALEQAEDALEAAEEDQGETQVGARLRPLGRRVGRFTSRRVRSAEGVLGEGLEQLKASPRESIKSAAQYSRGVWARINGLNIGDSGVVEVLKAYPVPRVPREKREARVLRLTIEVQDRDKALTEAQRARDAIMAQGGAGGRARVAMVGMMGGRDGKVSMLSRVFAGRTLEGGWGLMMLALEGEGAAPRGTLSRGGMKDMRRMVAELGVMDLSLRRLISRVDRQQSQLIDDEALSKLAMEIPDRKSRLAIADEPNVAMSLDMMRERMSLTVNESVETIREAGTFLVRGVRLLGSDIGTSVRLFLRAAFGTTLRPREVQVLRRTFLDVFTFVPFMIILITPITPVGHVLVFGFIQKYFPQLFPSQFTTRRQELMQKYEELKDQLAMAEEQADAANESEALRRAVAAVSSVRGIISGAVSDAADALAGGVDEEAQSKLEQQRVNALRAELDETEIRLNETSDDDDEEPKTASAKKSD